jgi:hypothetical protein
MQVLVDSPFARRDYGNTGIFKDGVLLAPSLRRASSTTEYCHIAYHCTQAPLLLKFVVCVQLDLQKHYHY